MMTEEKSGGVGVAWVPAGLRVKELEEQLSSMHNSLVCAFNQLLDLKDLNTGYHSTRLAEWAVRVAQELGVEESVLKDVEVAALLHDIGKIGVPDAILRKPSRLTEEEWERMREHPLHGQQILRGIKFLTGAARVVAQHHEKWDGSGYPLGLKGEDIDICARIFSVADAFDAITSDRVYRQGRSYEVALAELDEWAGRQFDAKIVEAFHRVPLEDWEELRRRSLMRKPQDTEWKSITAGIEPATAHVS